MKPCNSPSCSTYEGHHSDENGPFEVFWSDRSNQVEDSQGYAIEPGWYWWSCSPGCLPDGEAMGPYATSTEAWQAATDLDMSIGHKAFAVD